MQTNYNKAEMRVENMCKHTFICWQGRMTENGEGKAERKSKRQRQHNLLSTNSLLKWLQQPSLGQVEVKNQELQPAELADIQVPRLFFFFFLLLSKVQ